MRIGSAGNVSVGTTNTTVSRFYINHAGTAAENGLYVYSNVGLTSPLVRIIQDGAGSTGDAMYLRNDGSGNALTVDDGSSGNTVFVIKSSGFVGIGTSSPTDTVSIGSFSATGASSGINLGEGSLIQTSVNTTSYSFHVRFKNPNSQVGTITTSGTSTSYNTSSDYRLKENVSYDFDATTRLKQLKPARFNFIADANTTVDGFLAHEVSSVVPEAISGEKDAMKNEEYEVTPAVLDEDGNVITEAVMGTREVPEYQGIDQSKLVPLLVKTIQELEARITALETNQP